MIYKYGLFHGKLKEEAKCPDVKSFLEWNEGGHFREPALRTARAFVWAVGW